MAGTPCPSRSKRAPDASLWDGAAFGVFAALKIDNRRCIWWCSRVITPYCTSIVLFSCLFRFRALGFGGLGLLCLLLISNIDAVHVWEKCCCVIEGSLYRQRMLAELKADHHISLSTGWWISGQLVFVPESASRTLST